MKAILVIGACGSGKTWVMKELIKRFKCIQLGKIGMFLFHRSPDGHTMVLGKYDGSTFEGSDKLSMAVMRDLPRFLDVTKSRKGWIICEGDRFTNSTFIEGAKPIVIKIADDGTVGRKKRKSNQTERQIKSIATRVSKIPYKHLVMSSNDALDLIVDYLKGGR